MDDPPWASKLDLAPIGRGYDASLRRVGELNVRSQQSRARAGANFTAVVPLARRQSKGASESLWPI